MEWQLIESIPIDKLVLVFIPNINVVMIAVRKDYFKDFDDSLGLTWDDYNGSQIYIDPTHWMPLPNPPVKGT